MIEKKLGIETKADFGAMMTYSTIQYGLVRRYTVEGFGNSMNMTIYATREAVTVKSAGFRVSSVRDLNAVAAAMTAAFKLHTLLVESDGASFEEDGQIVQYLN